MNICLKWLRKQIIFLYMLNYYELLPEGLFAFEPFVENVGLDIGY
jgi:hypothetical protein